MTASKKPVPEVACNLAILHRLTQKLYLNIRLFCFTGLIAEPHHPRNEIL